MKGRTTILLIEQQFLTVSELAFILSKSKSHIYDLIARGDLKAIRISQRRTRILVSSYVEFAKRIDNQKVEAYNRIIQPPTKGA